MYTGLFSAVLIVIVAAVVVYYYVRHPPNATDIDDMDPIERDARAQMGRRPPPSCDAPPSRKRQEGVS